MDQILTGHFAGRALLRRDMKLLDWNIERGFQPQGIMEIIRRENPDICVFQEVDLNARRTDRRNVAEEFASEFRYDYVFGVEFQELSQGSHASPAYHGQAICARAPIRSPRVLRFANQTDAWAPRWFLPQWSVFQPRRGGRMALVAELELRDGTLVVYNVHLESRGPEQLRFLQLREVVEDAGRYGSQVAVIIAGDMNTRVQPSPCIDLLEGAGFRNVISGPAGDTKVGGGKLDWVFGRGQFRCERGRVHRDTLASDHYPVSVQLNFPR